MAVTTLDHERAQKALKAVQRIAEGDKELAKKFRSYAENLPAVIVRNGLGQALAMEAANGKVGTNADKADQKAHKELYEIVANWVLEKVYGRQANMRPLQVIDEIIKSDQNRYMRAQQEALLLLQWVKRFANATIERDTSD